MKIPIRIPIDYDRDTKYETVTITTEIQAQILAPVLERIAALEHQHDWMLLNGSWASKPAPVAADKPLPHDNRVVVTNPDAYKGADQPAVSVRDYRVERAECYIPDGYRDKGQPAADDAAGIIAGLISTVPPYHNCRHPQEALPAANAVLAAIRRGEVPGAIWSDDYLNMKQIAIYNEQIADLRAKLAEAEKALECCAGCMALAAERDKALARVAELERALHQHYTTENELNACKAELAAERERCEATAISRNVANENLRQATANLADMKERAEKAEESQRLTQKAREDDRGRLQQKCSDWGTYWRASDAHGVKLNIAQATELLADALGVEVEIAARAEADALRAELAALKARKVIVGTLKTPSHYGNMEACAFHRGIEACAERVRAAGVALE